MSAKARGEKMSGATVQIVRKISEEGKLFGSVGIKDICDAMHAVGFTNSPRPRSISTVARSRK